MRCLFSYKQLYECQTFFIIIFISVLRFEYIALKIIIVCLVQKVFCTSYLNTFVYVSNSCLDYYYVCQTIFYFNYVGMYSLFVM